jgi:amino acid adenylation domain-containing protein
VTSETFDTIPALFDRQVSARRDTIAVRCGSEALTFAGLAAKIDRITRCLTRHRIRPGDRVAVAMPHSTTLVASYIAIAKMGAVFVGVEPRWPIVRVCQVIADSGSVATLTTGPAAAAIAECPREIIDVDAEIRSDGHVSPPPLEWSPPAHDHAVVYTSGTTGFPNGVAVPTRSVINRLKWLWSTHSLGPNDVALLYTSCATISFPLNCLGPLLRGVTTIVTREALEVKEITRTAIESSVSVMSASPGFWNAILDELELGRKRWPSLRLARTGGEQLRPEFVARWYRIFPSVPLLNVYGATECSTSAVFDTRTFKGTNDARVPVGRPVDGVAVTVLDSALRPVNIGTTGDVFVGGAPLADGYLGKPALTATRFVASPFGSGERLFKTGDAGRWREDGCLEIVGRLDEQVKVRGFRVDIGEVEAALWQTAGIRAAAVVMGETGSLTAHVELDPSTAGGTAAVRSSLAERLPAQMIPARFVLHDRLPRAASGKVDKSHLRDPAEGRPLLTNPCAPRTATEIVLCAIWRRILSSEIVGIDDDFFELGGHSLAAMQIVSCIYDTFDREVGVTTVFDNPTVRLLARHLDDATALCTHAARFARGANGE